MTLRDFLLLATAVVVGLLLYDYLSAHAVVLSELLIRWWNLDTYIQYRIADAVPFCLTAMAVGALLVLVTLPLARNPDRLAIYLTISLPLVYLAWLTYSATYLFTLREALSSTIRIFTVVGLAFAVGSLLTSRLLLRALSKPS